MLDKDCPNIKNHGGSILIQMTLSTNCNYKFRVTEFNNLYLRITSNWYSSILKLVAYII